MNFIQSFGATLLALYPTFLVTRFAIGQTRRNLAQNVQPKGDPIRIVILFVFSIYVLHFGYYAFQGAQFCTGLLIFSALAVGITWATGKPARKAIERDAALLAQGHAKARQALEARETL